MEKENEIGLGVESFKFSFSFSGPRKLLDSIMTSPIVSGLAWLVCILLAFVFGAMFIIGSADLLKGKKTTESVVTIEKQNEMAGENEEEVVIEELE